MEMRPEVLVLDDEAIVCDRLKAALEKAGFAVETYTESARVVKRLEEKKFHVVVTDLKMKEWDGIEVLKLIKTRSPETKVIMITGFATAEKAKEALALGAHDFIAKPFKLSRLRDIVISASREPDGGAPQRPELPG
ncbi:MAG: response regulator [Elusimicrobia bacterium]|nr:response regulator [Elusimicrobiota bacterium]